MFKRLNMAKELLKNNGVIFISIDDNEFGQLKLLCDEIFGEENFISDIIWNSRKSVSNDAVVSLNHNYTYIYAKNISEFNKRKEDFKLKLNIDSFSNPDNDPRGPWQSVTLSVQAGHAVESQFYSIESPTGKIHNPPKGRCWIYNEERMQQEISNNNIWFGSDGNGVPRLKKLLVNTKLGIVPETLWDSNFAGTTKDAKKELLDLNIYDEDIFDTPKPEQLLYRIIQIATNKDDLILDCFLGSGTTAAVAHKLGRDYIGIDIDERTFKYACERLKKVCQGENGGISNEVQWSGGDNYQVCKWN